MSNDSRLSPDFLRIGAVSYLNTKPLVEGLDDALGDAELVYALPSRLSDALSNDELEVALVPSIELAAHPEWTIVSDACIASRGPVLSVKLLFRVPPPDVRTLALDEGSRTSAVLAQILLAELYGVHPQLSSLPIGSSLASSAADAVLIIGDRAMHTETDSFVEVWDLGDRWCRWAELPFVFAMWVSRPGVPTRSVASALSAARDRGCEQLSEIATRQAEAMSLSSTLVEDYLRKNLYFYLGPKERRGLELFYQRAAAFGLIESAVEVSIDDCPIEG